jgi:hypothetical protein
MVCENNTQRLHLFAALLIIGGIVTTIVGATQIPQTPNGGAPFIGDAATYNEALRKEQLQSSGFRVIVIGLSVFGSGSIIVLFRLIFCREELSDPLSLQQSIALNLPLPPQQAQRRVRIVPEAIVIREERPAPVAAREEPQQQEQQQQERDAMRKARAWLGDQAPRVMRPMAAGPHITIIPTSGPRGGNATVPV